MIPYIRGRTTRQAHVGIPEGTVEEEFARNGFFGKYAHLYRTEAPVNWLEIDGPLKPRAYNLNEISEPNNQWSRPGVLGNEDLVIRYFSLAYPMQFYFRNADADELFFVHKGNGYFDTDFGEIVFSKGDYITLPRGITYRITPSEFSQFLLVESFSEIDFPEKGMLGQHALFDPAVIKVPEPKVCHRHAAMKAYKFETRIQRAGEITRVYYPDCPLNAVGWKGTLAPTQLNVSDIRPVLSDRYHLPPSAHTTFVARNFVVCTFLPRPLENGDPEALKVPFYHSNIDFDEVIFYHEGNFFSRDGISQGMMTFHPQGIAHGPHKGAVKASANKKETDEIAVMIDTKRPLKPTDSVLKCELKDYYKSWQEPK